MSIEGVRETEKQREREMKEGGSRKPHAVCIAVPLQGHLKPMLNLAKLLHHKGFHITFVNTHFNHNRLLKSRGPNSLDGLPDFRFESIPDGLPPSDPDAGQDVPSVATAVRNNFLSPFMDLITTKLHNDPQVPPVTAIFADVFLSFAFTAGEKLGVPVISFCTVSTAAFLGMSYYRALMDKGYTPLKDLSCLTNGYLETVIDWIPGMKNMRLRDFPGFMRVTDANDWMFNFIMEEAEIASQKKGLAIVFNSYDELEGDALEALKPRLPPSYAIGPIHLLLDRIAEENPIISLGYNLWKEEPKCLEWLDSKEPNSVVYVNFGSIAVMSPEQLAEFAWGLAESKRDFLWIIRPDLVIGESAVVPPEFEEETKGRGFIASWCPQEQVLKHGSIALFLTHSGWNSSMESISSGVPMICWPFFADQPTNCRYSCKEWGIGLEVESDAKRDEVKRLVMEAMEGDEGKRMKKRVMELKELAHEAAAPNGSSSLNLDEVVKQVILNAPTKD